MSYRDAARAPAHPVRAPRKGTSIAGFAQSPRLRGRDSRGVLRKPVQAEPVVAEPVQETLEQHDIGRTNATELTRVYAELDKE